MTLDAEMALSLPASGGRAGVPLAEGIIQLLRANIRLPEVRRKDHYIDV
jgi:hypothetical protein